MALSLLYDSGLRGTIQGHLGPLVSISCHGNQSSSWISIPLAILRKDHPRNIPVKFGWNWLSGLGGDVVWSNCWRTTNDIRYTTHDGRRTPDIQRSEKFPMSTLCSGELKTSHAHWRPCFLTNLDKNVKFVRGSPNNYFCKIISKSGKLLFFYNFFKDFPSVAMATRVLLGI